MTTFFGQCTYNFLLPLTSAQQVPRDCFQLWRGSVCNIRQKVNCFGAWFQLGLVRIGKLAR